MSPSAIDSSVPASSTPGWMDRDDLRTSFTLAMSAMYKTEVPLYGKLVEIVQDVNTKTIKTAIDSKVLAMRHGNVEPSRVDIERHGAIRLGTPHELRTVRRIFGLIGLHAVGYYDLSQAGLPMHATCFRPRTEASLRKNPFRVFTSLLRPELIKDAAVRQLALDLLAKRNIFSVELMQLLDLGDAQDGRLTTEQSRDFIVEAMKSFSWHSTAAASHEEYQFLKTEHPILADVVCFRSAHINHLTPRTLDITAAQEKMLAEGLQVKDRIEGPPPRTCPILLRQTSFLAIDEPIQFSTGGVGSKRLSASHRARFGEIEERGAAVTPMGRKLYDQLLGEVMAMAEEFEEDIDATEYERLVESAFKKYPDNWEELRRQRLIYYTYRCTDKASSTSLSKGKYHLDTLLDEGLVEATPITYEDFLPLSAAGIFQSNLGSKSPSREIEGQADVEGMEESLGERIHDSDELYKTIERESAEKCAAELGIGIEG